MNWKALNKHTRIEAIRSVHRPGMTAQGMADALGIGKNAVHGFYHRYPEALSDCPLTLPQSGRPAKPKKRRVREQYLVWTAEKRAAVAAMLKDGKTSGEIGEKFGVKRHAIVGLVHRDASLRAIGFNSRQHKRLSETESARRQREARARRQAKLRNLPCQPSRKPFKPVIVSNNVNLMVQDFIAKNGVRRFEAGARADYWALSQYLEERGYRLTTYKSRYKLAGPSGRPRVVDMRDAVAIADRFRMAEGLEPFLAA